MALEIKVEVETQDTSWGACFAYLYVLTGTCITLSSQGRIRFHCLSRPPPFSQAPALPRETRKGQRSALEAGTNRSPPVTFLDNEQIRFSNVKGVNQGTFRGARAVTVEFQEHQFQKQRAEGPFPIYQL